MRWSNVLYSMKTLKIDLDLEMLVFIERGKSEYSENNLLEQRWQTQPTYDAKSLQGIKSRPHLWEVRALTTAPYLLPSKKWNMCTITYM